MSQYIVIVRSNGLFEIDRVPVEAQSLREASDTVRESRQWPAHCTFTPRLIDTTDYRQHPLDSGFCQFDRMPA